MNEKPLSEPELSELIKSGLSSLHISFSPIRMTQLITYIIEIEKWNNRRLNLIKATGKTLVIKHLFDTLAFLFLFQKLKQQQSILDIGSGAGFPGIPLSIFMPDSAFILAESLGKKAQFLRNVIILCGLKNTDVFHGNFINVPKKVDIITFRALAPIKRVLPDIVTHLNPGGRLIAYKGRREKIDEELDGLDTQEFSIDVIKVDVPLLENERHAVMIQPLN